jgi:CP family cyanate transporter-like MFS transporter
MALVAFNLRPSITSVGPVLTRMRDDVPLSSALASVLTALPVMCFAAMSFTVPLLMRRYRLERAMLTALVLLVAGLAVRVGPVAPAVFAGTILACAAIAVMNVLLPVLIKRDAPERAGLLTGMYVMMIAVGASLGAGITVPVADGFGGDWRWGLGLWIFTAIPAAVYWAVRLRPADAPVVDDALPSIRGRIDWPVTLFFGFQSGVFYAAVGWLPSVLEDHGYSSASAGGLMSLALIVGIPIAIVAPWIARRLRDARAPVAGFVLLAGIGLLGLAAAPSVPLLWMTLFGIGIGGTFPLSLMLIVDRSTTPNETQRLSSVAQTLGYALGIAGPLAVGGLHNLAGGWTTPLVLLGLVMLVPTMLSGVAAGTPLSTRRSATQ